MPKTTRDTSDYADMSDQDVEERIQGHLDTMATYMAGLTREVTKSKPSWNTARILTRLIRSETLNLDALGKSRKG